MQATKTASKIQATLTAGDRMLVVDRTSVSVFPARDGTRSNATWVADRADHDYARDYYVRKFWITRVDAFPAELNALIHGVLNAESPLQPLMDWVIEYGPKNLAAEIESLQADLLANKAADLNPFAALMGAARR